MKRLVLTSIILFSTLAASAECKITYVTDKKTSAEFDRHGGWNFENFDLVCAKLRRERARIMVNAMASVLTERSIGWASLSVVDIDSNISTSDFASMSTQANTYASQDNANELMIIAMNSAAQDWHDLDKALAALDIERQRVRAKFAKRK